MGERLHRVPEEDDEVNLALGDHPSELEVAADLTIALLREGTTALEQGLGIIGRAAETEALERLPDSDIKDALQQLPEEFRVVLTLFLLEGYDHEEISGILKISNNLSRIRFLRAKQKLLKILKENRLKKSFIYN